MADRTHQDPELEDSHPAPQINADDDFTKMKSKKKQDKKPRPDYSEEPATKKQKISETTNGAADNGEMQNLNITEDQNKLLKEELRERKRKLDSIPSVILKESGERALLTVKDDERTPIFFTDIQHLVMSALLGKNSPCTPSRWCDFKKPQRLSHTVVVCFDGMSLHHYLPNENKFEKINRIFDTRLEVVMPPNKEDSLVMVEELTQAPLSNVQAHMLIDTYGSLEAVVDRNKDPTLIIKSIFPMTDSKTESSKANDIHPNDKFPRTKLLLSALQMVDEGYPMPLRGELSKRFSNYVLTNDKYSPVTDRSPLFGVDCEMCHTSMGVNELTRISIVNEDFETVYETLVRPLHPIVDYLTPYSGITKEIMAAVTKTVKDVHQEVRNLLPPDAILVGQSLNSDLNAMRMMHPYCIDTSVCFNISGFRATKSKLQKLAMAFLKESIQEHIGGHDSTEDCISSLKLVKLKLANTLEYGDEILTQKKRLNDIIRAVSGDTVKNNLLAHASQRERRTAIITSKALPTTIHEVRKKAEEAFPDNALDTVIFHELESNKEAVRKCREIALENALTICNLQIPAEDLLASSVDDTVDKVDKWVSKIWKSMAHNGLLIVLMGGAKESTSGVAKLSIKT